MSRRLVRCRALLPFLLLAAAPVLADDFERFYGQMLKLDGAHSRITFAVPFLGLTDVEGRFHDFTGTLFFDPQQPAGASATVVARAASLDTDSKQRDEDLKSAEFFDVAKYPLLVFRSTRVERVGQGLAVVGNLTFHGVTREITVPFRRVGPDSLADPWGNQRAGFEGSFRLDRRAYGMTGYGRFADIAGRAIGDEVEVTVKLQAIRWNLERFTFAEKSLAARLRPLLEREGLEAALARYRELKAAPAGEVEMDESQLNILGHLMLQRHKLAEAVALFEANAAAFPQSSNVWDDLAVGYAASGRQDAAREACKKALALDPMNTDALELQRRLGG